MRNKIKNTRVSADPKQNGLYTRMVELQTESGNWAIGIFDFIKLKAGRSAYLIRAARKGEGAQMKCAPLCNFISPIHPVYAF